MEVTSAQSFVKLWAWLAVLAALMTDPTEATILKRIRAKKEKDAQAAASSTNSQHSNSNGNGGYGQGHGHGHGPGANHHGAGGPGEFDPDDYDGYRDDHPGNHRPGYGHGHRRPNHGHGPGQGVHQDEYRGEPSHSPNRYAGNHNHHHYGGGGAGGGGSRGGLGGQGYNNRIHGNPGPGLGGFPPGPGLGGFNDDYYDGPAEDHSSGYGAVHNSAQNSGGGGGRDFERPPYKNHGYEDSRQYVDDYDDYSNGPPPPQHYNNDRPPTNFNLPSPAGHHRNKPSSFNENENIPEVIITEKRPLSASDLENGSLPASSNKRGLVERIRKWRNDHKNAGKSSDAGIR